MEKNKDDKIGIRANLYLPENLYNDYQKVKNYLKENGSSLSQILQEYIIEKAGEIK